MQTLNISVRYERKYVFKYKPEKLKLNGIDCKNFRKYSVKITNHSTLIQTGRTLQDIITNLKTLYEKQKINSKITLTLSCCRNCILPCKKTSKPTTQDLCKRTIKVHVYSNLFKSIFAQTHLARRIF